ncbi:hypothetical protein F4777DRAFT_455072 [Nemania sp. FL0916]|nr:hypothetical protein F4777DRAFT_455072 [Nemania sp. FL0916]
MYHHTNLDRSYSILCYGLRPQSAPMRMHGQVYGRGIYTTTDSQEVINNYASGTPDVYAKVLLICELAFSERYHVADRDIGGATHCSIYVTQDPEHLMVRIVILGKLDQKHDLVNGYGLLVRWRSLKYD